MALFVVTTKNAVGVQGANNQPTQQQIKVSISPTGNQVNNQNQVKTQNEGEEQQIQTETQEQENLAKGQKANENMSVVAQKVQLLLQTRTSGGIGDQVREVAREQNQAQEQIQQNLNKLEARKSLTKALFGTDYKAINSLKQQLEQNQLRIEQLTQLKNQLYNQGDITMVQGTIEALIQENTALQDMIEAEEQTRSLFGWLFRLLAK